jgi:drug/metabolite transporter (DMT)-like permease
MESAPGGAEGPPPIRVAAALLAVYLIWGSTYLGIRVMVETIPPFLAAGMRFVLAGAVLFLFVRIRGTPAPTRSHWKEATIAGGFLLVGGNGLVTFAEQTVPSGITSLIVAIVPLIVVVFEWVGPTHTKPTIGVLSGISLGLVGVAVLMDPTASGAARINPLGAVLLLIASVLWSFGTLYSRSAKLPDAPILAIGMQMLAGGALLLGTGVALGELGRIDIAAVSQRSAVAFVYLVLLGGLVGFPAYLWLIRNVQPALATTYAFVNPVVAVILGFIILAEPITGRTVLAAAVIITGVAIITQARSRVSAAKARKAAAEAAPDEPA